MTYLPPLRILGISLLLALASQSAMAGSNPFAYGTQDYFAFNYNASIAVLGSGPPLTIPGATGDYAPCEIYISASEHFTTWKSAAGCAPSPYNNGSIYNPNLAAQPVGAGVNSTTLGMSTAVFSAASAGKASLCSIQLGNLTIATGWKNYDGLSTPEACKSLCHDKRKEVLPAKATVGECNLVSAVAVATLPPKFGGSCIATYNNANNVHGCTVNYTENGKNTPRSISGATSFSDCVAKSNIWTSPAGVSYNNLNCSGNDATPKVVTAPVVVPPKTSTPPATTPVKPVSYDIIGNFDYKAGPNTCNGSYTIKSAGKIVATVARNEANVKNKKACEALVSTWNSPVYGKFDYVGVFVN